MKIETDIGGNLEVPQKFVEMFKKAREEALTKNEDVEFWNQDDSLCFKTWFDEELFDEINPYENYYGKIVPEDIALFLVNYTTMNISFQGGYPIENWFTFKDNGYEYNICAFGWTSECEDSKGNLDMIGYKEKI